MPYLQSLKSWTISECSEGQFFDTIVLQIPGGKKKDGNKQGEKVWVDHSNLGPLFESQVTPVRSFSN